jgi:hypothetical protein
MKFSTLWCAATTWWTISFVHAQDMCRMCDSGTPGNAELIIPFLAIGEWKHVIVRML